jgi:protein ImuB
VAERCLRFTPQIALRVPDAIFLEIGKCYRLYSEEQFLARADTLLRRTQTPAKIGMGSSLEEALLSARFGTSDLSRLSIVALHDLVDPLRRDPLAEGCVNKLTAALQALGISTLAQFRAVPRAELSSRFGAGGLLCRQKLDGELLSPWKPWVPPEVITEQCVYDFSDFTPSVEPLLFDAKRLLDRIFSRLRLRALRAACLEITFRFEKLSVNPERERKLRLEFLQPQADTKGSLPVLRDFFQKEFDHRPVRFPIESLIITVVSTAPALSAQKNLFHSREERQEALASLLSQLSEAHGAGSIFQAKTVEERVPELSWEKVPECGAQAVLSRRIPLRPTHLVRPRKIAVTATQVCLPKAYRIKGFTEVVERISTRWLGAIVERTYFQVEVEHGPMLWIYCEAGNEYFLHGYYG